MIRLPLVRSLLSLTSHHTSDLQAKYIYINYYFSDWQWILRTAITNDIQCLVESIFISQRSFIAQLKICDLANFIKSNSIWEGRTIDLTFALLLENVNDRSTFLLDGADEWGNILDGKNLGNVGKAFIHNWIWITTATMASTTTVSSRNCLHIRTRRRSHRMHRLYLFFFFVSTIKTGFVPKQIWQLYKCKTAGTSLRLLEWLKYRILANTP